MFLFRFAQDEDRFFDADDMEKFADEGTMDDDLEGELSVRLDLFQARQIGEGRALWPLEKRFLTVRAGSGLECILIRAFFRDSHCANGTVRSIATTVRCWCCRGTAPSR